MSDKPCVVVRIKQAIPRESAEAFMRHIDAEEARIGCKILVLPEFCEVASANNAACGCTQTIGDYSVSMFCQTREDLEILMDRFEMPKPEPEHAAI